MEFFNSAIQVLQTLVIALGAGLGIWEMCIRDRPMTMSQDGDVLTADNCRITNNSYGAVRVRSVSIVPSSPRPLNDSRISRNG